MSDSHNEPIGDSSSSSQQGEQQQPDQKEVRKTTPTPPPVVSKEDEGHFMNPSGIACVVVAIVSGLIFGTMLQFIGSYIYYNRVSKNCEMFKSEASCLGLMNANCRWDDNTCKFSDFETLDCGNFTNPDDCGSGGQGACKYNYRTDVCFHGAGWDAVEIGIFAAAPVFGGIFSGVTMNELLKRLRWVTLAKMIGCLLILSGILMTVGHMVDSYGVIVASRLIHGFVAVGCTSFGTLYARRRRPDVANTLGPIMQLFICFGFFSVAAVSLGVDPKPEPSDGDLNINERIQGIFLVAMYLLGLFYLLIGFIVQEPPQLVAPVVGAGEAEEETFTNLQVLKFFTKGAVLGMGIHATGIGIFVSFAPLLVSQAGLDAMLGSLLITLAQFLGSSLAFIPLQFKVVPRRILLGGMVMTFTSCMISFIGVFPGIIAEGSGTLGVTMTGLMLFCVTFNSSVGPQFWVVAARIFPKRHMQFGIQSSVAFYAGTNLLVNLLFPIAVDRISGGPAGNQSYGYGVMFLVFAGLTLTFFILINCFVDAYTPPPPETLVKVSIADDADSSSAVAEVEKQAAVGNGEPEPSSTSSVSSTKMMNEEERVGEPSSSTETSSSSTNVVAEESSAAGETKQE